MKTNDITKRHYEKPVMKVYQLQPRHQILAGSPLPIGDPDDTTDEQW